MRAHLMKRAVLALALAVPGAAIASAVAAPPAHADGCYTWNRTLSRGSSGGDVRELQLRIAGWAGNNNVVELDGQYGPKTAAAVRRFQSAYGLRSDGVAGPQTFAKLYQIQDNDCTPRHFTWNEMDDGCGRGGWTGGPLTTAQTRQNALRTMWKLEALRKGLGDQPLKVTSGFRSRTCNSQVGGASNSQHLYGNAADLVSDNHSLCQIARAARNHGFSGIIGPGVSGHNSHVHVDSRRENNRDGSTNNTYWAAPDCGITPGYR
ncbi:D-Ala-D-Ala carboxypeptidase family metallohydrolase [Micromonospora sp. NPDC049900]|uniref:D-Ala-D-Ala carboxypeptidase family metallohydrolase n=1 Tax=unclassified Micromonospora TaxID=2617518 RepID=UPI003792529A